MAVLTVKAKYAITSLEGRGLSEYRAKDLLRRARQFGSWLWFTPTEVIKVSSEGDGKYTIERPY